MYNNKSYYKIKGLKMHNIIKYIIVISAKVLFVSKNNKLYLIESVQLDIDI